MTFLVPKTGNSSKITESFKIGMQGSRFSRRASVPPPRLTYMGLGQQGEARVELRHRPPLSRKLNMESQVGSGKSSSSKKAAARLKTREELMKLTHEYEDNLAMLQQRKDEIQDNMDVPKTLEVAKQEALELNQISREEKAQTMNFERKKKQLLEKGELEQEFIDLEEDENKSQYLGSEEETVLKTPFHHDKKNDDLPVDDDGNIPDNYDDNYYAHPHQPMDPVQQLAVAISQLGNKGGGGGRDKWLPEFTGDPAQWCIFKSAFYRTTNKHRIDDGENLSRLQGALKGEAKAAVLHLMANVQNVDRIMQVLERRFGRPELVLDFLVERAKSCKSPDIAKPATLVEFGTTVEALVTNICAFNEEEYMYNKQLINELVRKMPVILQDKWYGWLIEDPARKPNLKFFSRWLERETRIAELRMTPEVRFTSTSDDKDKGRRGRGAIHSAIEVKEESRTACAICGKKNHVASKCFSFKRKSIDDRWEAIKSKKLCFLCLGEGHTTRKCTSSKECGVDGCTYKHHALLHRKFSSDKTEENWRKKQDSDDEEASNSKNTSENAGSMNMVSLNKELDPGSLAIIPIVVHGPHGKSKEFAFLDMGATSTLIQKELSDELGLDGKCSKFSYIVFGDKMQTQENSKSVNLKISRGHGNDCYNMKNVRTVSRIAIPKMSLNVEELKEKYPHLRRMKLDSFRNAQPRILIGFDNFKLYAPRLILEDKKKLDSPIGCRSHLGWYLCSSKSGNNSINFLAMAKAQEEENLHDMVKDFFSVENFGVKVIPNSHRSKEDKKALQMLEATTMKGKERWETCLLWKNEEGGLPESKSTAVRFLKFMEKKMDDDPTFAKLCMEKFEDYISKGYLRKKVETEDEGRRYYLPWFFQFHPTKKPRLVFNAAAKTNGKCFNDFLMTGPDLLRPLPSVVMRFRVHLIALTADLKEFFHQVALREKDIKSQTVLYRGLDRNSPAIEYEMGRLFFGSTSSPCSAIFAKELNAEKYLHLYPEPVESIKLDFFMDDFLSGRDSEEEAIQLQQQVTEIHESGGFPIVKWNSNNEEVLSSIPAAMRANEDIKFSEKSVTVPEKTLGLYWSPQADEFCFKLSFHRVKKEVADGSCVPTKRQVISLIMAIFDPLGFLAPLKIKGLILLQEIWRVGVDWDNPIPYNIYEDWKSWLLELEQIKEIRVPRRLCEESLKKASNIQLHLFVDGSESGYACSAYLRIQTGGRADLKFIMGKSRVAPLKGLSVPRMELMAALMGSRLARTIKDAHQDQFKIDKIVFWCDSRCVLCWIRSTTGRFSQFVSNRIGEILETTNVENWRWVPSSLNAADDATRSVKNLKYTSQSRWLQGSDFLLKSENEWPKEKMAAPREEELERREVICQIRQSDDLGDATGAGLSTDEGCRLGAGENEYLPNIDQFASWHRLIRATAARYWAVRKFLKRGAQYITIDDMKRAELLWIKRSQEKTFKTELRCLEAGKPVANSSKIFTLSPGLNKNGVVVVKGRLDNANVSDNVKYPPILDPDDRYVQLMIQWFHRTSQHFGQERIVNELRKHAWILRCRVAVRKCKSECMICKKKSTQPVPPRMGQLPFGRIKSGHAPFYFTAVDYFGPFHVKIRRGTEKRWGVLFSCLTTRAVHLELAESLDASDFINALVRFMNLRGIPAHIWSDNGTNFVGGEREIRESLAKWNEDELRRGFGLRGIEWHFIPPSSPHMGGSWERLVGVVKKILYQLLNKQEPKESVLRTLFTEVTYIMNSRPITRASPDPDDLSCLTPNDLLNIKCVVGSAVPGLYASGDRYRKSWRQVQLMAYDFWKRWSVEYLPWLVKREKWEKPAKPLEVGDVVLVLEDNAPRNAWKMGKIEKTFPAKDGQVRSVEVLIAHVDPKDPKKKVGYSYLRRPAIKICPLSP